MHFSKTYSQLLVTLPPEFRSNAFEYRKLKQLINQTVTELDSLGLGPAVLQSLHATHENRGCSVVSVKHLNDDSIDSECMWGGPCHHTIVYEIAINSSVLEPRLRLSSGHPSDVSRAPSIIEPIYRVDLIISEQSLSRITRALSSHPFIRSEDQAGFSDNHISDLIITLPSDAAFFQLLTSTLSSVSAQSNDLYDTFNSALADLAASISLVALPASSTAPRSFSAYSFASKNAMTFRPRIPGGSSDLYVWRDIFRLYTEVQVFESLSESTGGERSVKDAENQLKLFRELVSPKRASLVLPGSREALDAFLGLNMFVLEAKKFERANSEATRKILKKHAKRTTFPIPSHLLEQYPAASARRVTLVTRSSSSLPRLLVQAIGEILLPVIPHIDDYSCPICTSIAFRPIRLGCGHFFCVRCLAKMQKRGMSNCPICRASTVLKANSSNVDYGLLNFMADWFPIESREKLRSNEREVTREQFEEFGLIEVPGCRIM